MKPTKSKKFYRDCIYRRKNRDGKENKTWYFRHQIAPGNRPHCTLNTENVEEAIELAIEIYESNKNKSRITINLEKTLTLKALSEKYITNKRKINDDSRNHYHDQQKAILRVLGENYLANSMNMDEAERFVKVLEQKGLKPQTIYHRVRHLKKIYQWAVGRYREIFPYDRLTTLELPRIPKKNKAQRNSEILMEDELMDFFYEVNDYNAPLAFTSLCTGMRSNEVRSVKGRNLLLCCFGEDVNEFDLTVTKGNDEIGSKNRKISIPDCLAIYLENWINNHQIKNDGYIFPNLLGEKRNRTMKAMKNTFKLIGRGELAQHHTFRRTWATYMEKYLDIKHSLDIELMAGWEDNEKATRMRRLYSNYENDIEYLIGREQRVSKVFEFLRPVAQLLIRRDNLSVGKPMEEQASGSQSYNKNIISIHKTG